MRHALNKAVIHSVFINYFFIVILIINNNILLLKNAKTQKRENYSKYLFAGVLAAVLIMIYFFIFGQEESPVEKKDGHVWSAQTDSLFIKDCYQKYKPQIKDDMAKQENVKKFCRCMLEKVKSKYDENEISQVKDSEIKQWDAECRELIWNSAF